MSEPTSIAGGIKLASLLLEEAEKQGLLDKVLRAFKSKPRILLLGATGAGKSNLLDSLMMDHPAAIPREIRTVYPRSQLLVIEGNNPFRFIDIPGDPLMEAHREDAIREALSEKSGIAGVVNVVSYGYHEYHLPRSSVFLQNGSVDPMYLEKHRTAEIDQLTEWAQLLGSSKTINWMITVATKADLWWNESEHVRNHYERGPYRAELSKMIDASLNPKFLMYSSVFSRFYGEAPMSGYFDEHDRHKLHVQFVHTLLGALTQHEL